MNRQIPLVQVKTIGRCVRHTWLWRGLSFELAPGETLGVVGPSGTGKSLLMRSLIGLDPLDEGEVLWQGRSLLQWEQPRLRRDFLYLAQSPGVIEGTVAENLRLIFQLKSQRDRRYSSEAALEMLCQIGRGEQFLTQPVERLSGGERQILSLVRGLLMQPKVLLLDEPTAALDMATTDQVEQLLQDWLAQDRTRGYLWISHSPEQIQRVTRSQLDLSRFSP